MSVTASATTTKSSTTKKYETIKGIPMKEYKRMKAKQYYTPRARNKVYKTLPSDEFTECTKSKLD